MNGNDISIRMPDGMFNLRMGQSFTEAYDSATLHRLSIDRLAHENLYPEFFKTELARMPEDVGYFVTRDDRTVRV